MRVSLHTKRIQRRNVTAFRVLAFALLFGLSGCFSLLVEEDEPEHLRFVSGDPAVGDPKLVVEGSAARMTLWRDTSSSLNEVLYESLDGKMQVRSFVDRGTNELVAFVDEVTGEQTVLVSAEGTDSGVAAQLAVTYNSSGDYLRGAVLLLNDGVVSMGDLTARQGFTGQITGALSAQSGQTGTWAVVAEATSSGVGYTLETANGALYVSNLAPVPESVLALAYVANPGSAAVPAGFSALSLPQILQVGGAIAIIGGLVGSAPVWVAAGIAMGLSGLASNEIGHIIEEQFSNDLPVAGPAVELLVDALTNTGTSLVDKAKALADRVEDAVDGAGNLVSDWVNGNKTDNDSADAEDFSSVGDDFDSSSSGIGAFSDSIGAMVNDLGNGLSDAVSSVVDSLPGTTTDVTGQAVLQDGTSYPIDGTLDENGDLQVSGTGDSGDTIDINVGDVGGGNFEGTFTTDTDNGTATGTSEALGNCLDTQGSGGEGTFTFAHALGTGPGTATFSYDAYTIEDAFVVRGKSGTLFSTGGLVSGGATVDLPISDSGTAIVFVSVSAPKSGTAWEYSLGCL